MMDDDAPQQAATAAKGIVLLLLSLLCLGTWPALLRLCTFRHEDGSGEHADDLYLNHANGSIASSCASCARSIRRWATRCAQNRHPCHAYIDYALAYVVFSSTVPLILDFWGNGSDSSSSLTDNATSSTGTDTTTPPSSVLSYLPLIISACLGGSLLSLGNISTQWSTTVYHSPLTTVLSLQASLCVVLGTTLNYRLEPERTAHPHRLFGGVALFLVAIGLSVLAHSLYAKDASHSVRAAPSENDAYTAVTAAENDEIGISLRDMRIQSRDHGTAASSVVSSSGLHDYHACNNGGFDDDPFPYDGKGERPDDLELPQSDIARDGFIDQECTSEESTNTHGNIGTLASSVYNLGLIAAFLGGLCFGFFSPAFNIAVNDPLHWNDGIGLSVAAANFWFSVAFATTSIFWNVCLMKNPPASAPEVERSTTRLYLRANIRDRALAVAAGLVCAAGNVLQFQGGKLAGFATSDLVQAFPIVGTAWDVAAFGEFHGARRIISGLIGCMYCVYLGGICLLASSVAV